MSLPRSAAELDPGWLSEVLATPITGVRVQDIGAGSGLFGVVLRLWLERDDGGPATVVVKLPTLAEANLAIGNALGIYEREVRFYRELAGEVPLRVPVCHFAGHDDGGSVIVLEDLVDLEVGDQVGGLTVERAEHVVDALAALHARFWDSPALDALGWLPRLDAPVYSATVPGIYHSAWPLVRERYGQLLGADALELGERVDARFEEIMSWCCQGPDTVVHTDSRLDNLFFDPAGGSAVAFVDWQLMLRGRGVSDVAYLVGTSLPVELQVSSIASLIERYHGRLVEHGVVGYTLEQCRRDYLEHSLYYLVGACTMAAMEMGNDRGEALAVAYITRVFGNALASGAGSLL